MGKIIITASIVTYHNNPKVLKRAIRSVMNSDKIFALFLIDNSKDNSIENLVTDKRIKYFHQKTNIGFGSGHNIAINSSIKLGSTFHIVINPDVHFKEDVIDMIVDYMYINEDVGLMMPRVLYPDGTEQYLPKLLPNPLSLVRRTLRFPRRSYLKFINNYELRWVDSNKIYRTPLVSGCFSFFRTKVFEEIGFYDERFFMYFEDFDISRRVSKQFKTIFFPLVHIYHEYDRGARREWKLFLIFIISAIRYFNKWGWLFDHERKALNNKALHELI